MPSKTALAERKAAKAAVYAANGQGPCPYPEGSRPARFWHKSKAHYWQMEGVFDEMAQVYGEFRPDRLAAAAAEGTAS
jgi:hypothetical protein